MALAAVVPLADGAAGRRSVVLTVNATEDELDAAPGDGVCRTSRGRCTLRAAVHEASELAGGGMSLMISVPAGTYRLQLDPPSDPTRDRFGGDLDLHSYTVPFDSVTITGAGAGRTVIEQRRTDRVLQVYWIGAVTIENVTVRAATASLSAAESRPTRSEA